MSLGGLGGLGGFFGAGQAAQGIFRSSQEMQQMQSQAFGLACRDLSETTTEVSFRPKSIRQELQSEVNEWLKGI